MQDAGKDEPEQPEGLHGYLGLLGIFLLFAPALGVHALIENANAYMSAWENLQIGQRVWAIFELGIVQGLIMIVAPAAVFALFVRKSARFPLSFVVVACATPLVAAATVVGGYFVFRSAVEEPERVFFSKEAAQPILTQIKFALICTIYMARSQRVKNTFVH